MEPDINLDELKRLSARYLADVLAERELSEKEYLEIGKLWNTVAHYRLHEADPEASRFYREVFDKAVPKMVEVLGLTAGRGMSLHSDRLQFTLGGILPETSRYRIPELET